MDESSVCSVVEEGGSESARVSESERERGGRRERDQGGMVEKEKMYDMWAPWLGS